MPEFKDLTGKKIGRWFVVERAEDHITPGGFRFTTWRCRCDCGTEKIVLANALNGGRSTSCGCVQYEHSKETARKNFSTHGESKTRLYKIWAGMKKRCILETSSCFKDYGGRGIAVCDEWMHFEPFRDWSLKNGYDDSLTIDRIDVNGNYEPSNCRWVDVKTQNNNRRTSKKYTLGNETHTLSQWADIVGMSYDKLYDRVYRGWSLERALYT